MKTWLKVLLVCLAILAVIIAVPVISYISYNNQAVAFESTIKARHANAQNVLSRVSTSVLEAVQVPEIAKNDLIEVVEAATSGRYGDDGTQAIVVAITEANPGQVDPGLYTRIQDLIAAGRIDFQKEQSILIDTKANYEIARNQVWSGLWMRIAGFPRIVLDEFDIVIDERTEEIYNTGRDKPLQLGS